MDEADKLCDRIAIIDHGELKALDSPMMLKASIAGQHFIEVTFSSVPEAWAERLASRAAVDAVTRHESVFRLASSNSPLTVRALFDASATAGLTVTSLAVQSTTLDDVFVHYAGRALRDGLQDAPVHDFSIVRGGR
jgi:ABC-2 type transport system ATP-binding protein